MGILNPEFVDNPENRCPVILIVDTSASMEGKPITALNEGLATFKFDVEQDELAALRVEVAIITFGSEVKLLQDFITVDDFTAPQLETEGLTPLGEALHLALDTLESRKNMYKAAGIGYYRPWIFLITDGAPTDGDLWKEAAHRLHSYTEQNKLAFYAVAVEGADQCILQELSGPGSSPIQLEELAFNTLFKWLSSSVRTQSRGHKNGDEKDYPQMILPRVSGWSKKDVS